jgi:hypothetical protein
MRAVKGSLGHSLLRKVIRNRKAFAVALLDELFEHSADSGWQSETGGTSKKVLGSEFGVGIKGGTGETGGMDEGLRSEVRSSRILELRIQNPALSTQNFGSPFTPHGLGKENRHDTHYSHQSFPVSLGGTWC